MNSFLGILLISSISGTPEPMDRKRHRDEPVYKTTLPPPSSYRAVSNIGKTATGRIVEQYNTTIVAENYGDWLARSIVLLQELDSSETMMVPNVSRPTSEMTLIGFLKIHEVLSSTHQSAIFTLSDLPRTLIKYQSNCGELDFERDLLDKPYIHPSIVEFAFTKRAAAYGLAPRVLLLSPPVGLCRSQSGKCQFRMSRYEFMQCRANPQSSLRYMIMDRVEGETLFRYAYKLRDNAMPFAQGMEIGVKLISLLERLHKEAKVGHGDIHESNVMIDAGTGKLTLIDFARSFALTNRKSKRIRPAMWTTHSVFSYREIMGFTPIALDDVLRAIETIARLINPRPAYSDYLQIITARDPNAIVDWKVKRNIFRIPSHDPVKKLRLDFNTTLMIESQLLHLLNVTRNTKADEPIPYTIIREAFSECLRLATR